MIEKEYNLLGLRKSTTLFLFRYANGKISKIVTLRPLSENEEKQCEDDNTPYIELDNGVHIKKNRVILYGDIDITNKNDLNSIAYYCYIPEDYDARLHAYFNYDKGSFTTKDGVAKDTITYDPILWFKYNHCLIGKPKKVLIYKTYYE